MAVIVFLLYGKEPDGRDAFQEEKYRLLAEYFRDRGNEVMTVCYHDENRELVEKRLLKADYTLVWINPIESGMDRRVLDQMLASLLRQGCRLSADPAVILKIGTKDILFETSDLAWGSNVKQYRNLGDFAARFQASLAEGGPRVLKQHRGDGGKGVFKIENLGDRYQVTQAADGAVLQLSWDDLRGFVEPYFAEGHPVLDQEWNSDMRNGVVRCYLTGSRVVGFGYQEINMLYPWSVTSATARQRHYYTENCGLFQDLRKTMEQEIVPTLMERYQISENSLPVLWDADHFIRDDGRYLLCEVNASCVSPFPESAIPYIYDRVTKTAFSGFRY